MASKNVNASQFASWWIAGAEWVTSGNDGVWVWSRVDTVGPDDGYKVGRVIFPGAGIGGATVTSAILRVKVRHGYYSGYPVVNTAVRFRIALASSTSLYTTDITANYITTTLANYADGTEYAFPVTSLLGNISNINDTFCAYIIIDTPDNADVTFENLSNFQSYLAIEYTEYTPTDSVLTLGTSGGNKKCDLYIGVGGVAKKVTDIYIGTASGNKRITSS
jgi:hypothetical protein